MKHLNGDILCAVDTETTGINPSTNSIWDLCVIPLDGRLNLHPVIKPFQAMMKPSTPFEPGALKEADLTQAEIINTGHDPFKVADLFEAWFEKMKLPQGKKIVPLAHNWPFDRGHLIEWLGWKTFDYYFSGDYRDTFMLASFHNDRKWWKNDPYEFSKRSLGACARRLDLEVTGLHRATQDCLTCIEVYKKLLADGLF